MSTNLTLHASREIFTKSGRSEVQTEIVSIRQTPTSVTFDIINLPNFEAQLDAFCKWVDEQESGQDSDEEWWEVYDDSYGKPPETYMSFAKEIAQEQCLGVAGATFYNDYLVKRVVLKGDPEFETIQESEFDMFVFPFHSEEEGHLGVGYRLVVRKPESDRLREEIQRLRNREFDLEFSII